MDTTMGLQRKIPVLRPCVRNKKHRVPAAFFISVKKVGHQVPSAKKSKTMYCVGMMAKSKF
jgi:hypothetical protein